MLVAPVQACGAIIKFGSHSSRPHGGSDLSGDAEKKRVTVSRRETEGYLRWKEKHGDAPRPPEKVDWGWSVLDEVQ